MPNGKTITLQNAQRCASDATKWETLDGQDITPRGAPKPSAELPAPTASPKQRETYVVQPKAPTPEIDTNLAAINICQKIERDLKLSCMVQKFNDTLRIMPAIKVWWPGESDKAPGLCHAIATIARNDTGNAFDPLWTVKIQSKHSIDIALASCPIRQ
ncbi:hypothetical protein HNP33_002530 [Comamonas odontotermitis]|uniref:Uncharacterized protein n=1 Tax=Comamonas odontotermitis TaxID=379895 RepID=A0ABR6RH19_9BURK|nr:hypothetical protein [Comamonas odontotermitis]MBB6578448.1 hypothetical protein [Comamonas odontotermitis]